MQKLTLRKTVALWLSLLGAMIWLGAKLGMSMGPGVSLAQFQDNFTRNIQNVFYFRATDQVGALILVMVIIWLVMLASYLVRYGQYMRGREHGSARFATPAEIAKQYEQEENIILSENVRLGLDMFKHQHNLNIFVLGGSGSGKSRGFCIPSLLSGNTNFVCSDPKGELLRSCGGALEKMGYNVVCLDLIDMDRSARYNPFAFLRKDEDVISMINMLIKSTTPKNAMQNDPFWEKSEIALLQAICYFLWYFAPVYEQTWEMVADMLRYADVREEDETYESPLDMLFKELGEENQNHIAYRQYSVFKLAGGRTAKSILISAAVRLSMFSIPAVAELTSRNEIDANMLNEEKTAIFCVMSDVDESFSFLLGLFLTQMFKELSYIADHSEGGRLKRHTRFILEEFYNCKITNEDEFVHQISTCRGRNYSYSLILQNVSMIKAMYEKTWESVIGCCDCLVYYGGNEQSTHQYLERELGKATILYDTYGKSYQSTTTNVNIGARELMTSAEIRQLPRSECLILLANEFPCRDRKYDLMSHKNIKLAEQGGAKPYRYFAKGRRAAV